jgi:hypothetical protein
MGRAVSGEDGSVSLSYSPDLGIKGSADASLVPVVRPIVVGLPPEARPTVALPENDAPRDEDVGPFFLTAKHDDYYPLEPVPVGSGGAPVVVRMARGARLEGAFVGRSTRDVLDRLRLVVEGPAANAEPIPLLHEVDAFGRRVAAIDADGKFSVGGLRPGALKATVVATDSESDVATIDDVEVVAGRDVDDPRLKGLDLDRLLSDVRVTVRDGDGTPVRDAVVSERWNGSLTWARREVDGDGSVVLRRFGETSRVVVTATGRAGVDLGRPTEDVVATLRPEIRRRVVMVLPEPLEFLRKTHRLSASLQRVPVGPEDDEILQLLGVDLLAPSPNGGEFGSANTVAAIVRSPGEYRAVLETRRIPDAPVAAPFPLRSTVVVDQGDDDVRIVLALDPESVVAVLRLLKQL